MSVSIIIFPVFNAGAQINQSSRIHLENNDHSAFIGKNVFYFEDLRQNLTPNTAFFEYEQGNFKRSSTNILNLGYEEKRFWIVFTLTNKSNKNFWSFDLGSFLDGRSALLQGLFLQNITEGRVLFNIQSLEDGSFSQPIPPTPNFPLQIAPNDTHTYLLKVDTFLGQNNRIAPKIELQKTTAFLSLSHFTLYDLLFWIISFAVISFAVFGIVFKDHKHALLAVFFLAHAFVLFAFEYNFILNAILPLYTIYFIWSLGILAGYLGSVFYFEGEDIELGFIYNPLIVSGIVAIGFVLKVILTPVNPAFAELAFMLSVLSVFGITIFLGLSRLAFLPANVLFMICGWGLLALCLVASNLTIVDMQNKAMALSAYWYALAVFSIVSVLAMADKVMRDQDFEKQDIIQKSHKAMIHAKKIQEKESADQKRLLRVIERERELMASLREQEVLRAEEMRIAKDEADAANKAKSAFLAVVSHEVRTPMTGIMGMVRFLLDTKLNSQQQEYVLAVQKSGETMMALLNDILDFEKIETGVLELEYIDFDLHQLVQGLVTLMSGYASSKNIKLMADIDNSTPRFVKGDPTRLRQVLLNLVNNAVKFTDKGHVKIIIQSKPIDEKERVNSGDFEIYFAVEDTGIGISEEAQKLLFEPFAQADKSITRKYGGTGLGLTICKRLIEAMGSTISVKSLPGRGTTFFYTLLMETTTEAKVSETEIDLKGKKASFEEETPPQKILVVEDNEMNRRVTQGILQKQGHEVHVAEDGEVAVEMCRNNHFDCIFMDMQMPGMDGIQATRAIRAMRDKPIWSVPIIALTGNVMVSDIQECYDETINGFVPKPVEPERILKILHDMVHGNLENPLGGKSKFKPDQDEEEALSEENVPQDSALSNVLITEPSSIENLEEEPEVEPYKKEDLPPIMQSLKGEGSGASSEAQDEVLDHNMINNLFESLGKESFRELIGGFLEKTDELIAALIKADEAQQMDQMFERSHELKGMAANFGFKELSQIASEIELHAKNKEGQKTGKLVPYLEDSAEKSKKALEQYIQPKD